MVIRCKQTSTSNLSSLELIKGDISMEENLLTCNLERLLSEVNITIVKKRESFDIKFAYVQDYFTHSQVTNLSSLQTRSWYAKKLYVV